ncbi:MAG TPA: RNA methyltransferase, partial [Anaerolineaceae bacterium]|nr:RNA methyltransferase [Anaerolineaceae bacterium]
IGVSCPKCKSETEIIHQIPLNKEKVEHQNKNHKINCEVLLDNVRSTFNVGAIFRSADGVGIKKIHLCGITPSPENLKVHKTSLGSENTIAYLKHPNAVEVVKDFRNNGYRIWAIEKTDKAQSIFDYKLTMNDRPTLLIVGNEIIGIDPDILEICDEHLFIPMVGLKNSLNVAIAFGIAVYLLTREVFTNT